MKVQLLYGESVIVASPARYRDEGSRWLEGELLLTDQRLLFAVRVRKGEEDRTLSMPLTEIAELGVLNSLGFLPMGFTMVLKSGERVHVGISRRDQWIALIAQAQTATTGASAELPESVMARLQQTEPEPRVVSWPAIVAWILAPLSLVPLLGLLPAVALLVFGCLLLLKPKYRLDKVTGVAACVFSGLGILFFGIEVLSLALQGGFTDLPEVREDIEIPLVMRVLQIAVLIFSIVLHECGHALAAYWSGDLTAVRLKRLTLNPIPHIDLLGSVILPAILVISNASFVFGWAKPVPVSPTNFRNRFWGNIGVSLAGVSGNLLVAMLAASLLAVLGAALRLLFPEMTSAGFWLPFYPTELSGVPAADGMEILVDLLKVAVLINLVLMVFNLLPIPPLDGSHVLEAILPKTLAQLYAKLRPFGMLIILVALWTNALDLVFQGVAIVGTIFCYIAGVVSGLG